MALIPNKGQKSFQKEGIEAQKYENKKEENDDITFIVDGNMDYRPYKKLFENSDKKEVSLIIPCHPEFITFFKEKIQSIFINDNKK